MAKRGRTTRPFRIETFPSDCDVQVNGDTNPDAAWYYPNPKPEASNIKDHIAFWKGVVVE